MTLITRDQIHETLDGAGAIPFDGGLLADLAYVMPSPDWLLREFSVAWLSFLEQLRVRQWAPERNDCDEFARGCAWFASLLHARTPDAPQAGLAFGEFWYEREAGGGHAINVAVIREHSPSASSPAPPLKLFFFEPQTGDGIVLSLTEIQSCTGYRI